MDRIILEEFKHKMTTEDWKEFENYQRRSDRIIDDLRRFLHEKFINEENTLQRDKYGRLCNITEYPGWYVYLSGLYLSVISTILYLSALFY